MGFSRSSEVRTSLSDLRSCVKKLEHDATTVTESESECVFSDTVLECLSQALQQVLKLHELVLTKRLKELDRQNSRKNSKAVQKTIQAVKSAISDLEEEKKDANARQRRWRKVVKAPDKDGGSGDVGSGSETEDEAPSKARQQKESMDSDATDDLDLPVGPRPVSMDSDATDDPDSDSVLVATPPSKPLSKNKNPVKDQSQSKSESLKVSKDSKNSQNNNVRTGKAIEDRDSDDTDDLENFDNFDFDEIISSTPGSKLKQTNVKENAPKLAADKQMAESSSSKKAANTKTADDTGGDEFSDDDDFGDDMLEELEAAEKSALNTTAEPDDELEEVLQEPEDDTPPPDVPIEDDDDTENQPQDKTYLEVLKQYFGYSKFRPMQWKILHSVMIEKKDNCVIMATGYGKSLCYQFPSLMTGRTTVVISPLISLMQDQVLGLQAANISSCYLGSAQENTVEVKRKLLQGGYRVVYITPEFATSAQGLLNELDNKVGIDLIAIDEAHCVSQWGHDFRAAFRGLGQVRAAFPQVPVMALTATATPAVCRDICKSLQLKNPVITCTGFDRKTIGTKKEPEDALEWPCVEDALDGPCVEDALDGPCVEDALDGPFVKVEAASDLETETLPQPTKTNLSGKPFTCNDCGSQFTSKSALNDHGSIEHFDMSSPHPKLLMCPIDGCDKKFMRTALYQDHLNAHSGAKPHVCINCGKRFGHRYRKRAHEVVCSGKRVIECKKCKKQFSSKYNLKIHEKGTHQKKTTRCLHCGKDFTFASNLTRHVKRKHARPNLFLSVGMKSGDIKHDLVSQMDDVGTKRAFTGPTIIYCPTKKMTESVAAIVQGMRVQCLPYHAGLSPKARKDAHKKFVNDEIQVVVATVAFGMGIDKPDCRRVIHYGAPKDVESYYQEIGRAGRDGMPSFCHTFYANSDFNTTRFLLRDIKNVSFKQHKLNMMTKMQQYLSTSTCRRRILLSHFDKKNLEQVGGTNNCCDNCRLNMEASRQESFYESKNWSGMSSRMAQRNKPVDYRKEGKLLMDTVRALNGSVGLTKVVLVLMGSVDQKVKKFKSYRVFGSGSSKKTNWWKAFGKQLLAEGYMEEVMSSGMFGSMVQLSQKGDDWFRKGGSQGSQALEFIPNRELAAEEKSAVTQPVSFKPQAAMPRPAPGLLRHQSSPPSTQPYTQPLASTPQKPEIDEKTAKLITELYTRMIRQRNELSQSTGYTPHTIASNKVLLDMAKIRPSTRDGLLRLEDFPEAKVEKFGAAFLAIITGFCKERDLAMDDFPDINLDKPSGDLPPQFYELTETQRVSYMMYVNQSLPLEEVASRRGLKTTTVVTHLAEAIRLGLPVDIMNLGVTPHLQKLITDTIRGGTVKSDISRLTKIKDELPTYVEYNHIKLVISSLVRQFGQTVLPTGELTLNPGQAREATDSSETQSGDSQAAAESQSTLTGSQYFQSGSQSGGGTKRKLPAWMGSGGKPVLTKKMKSNSLFR